MRNAIVTSDREDFRKVLRGFIERAVVPVFHEWEVMGHPPRDFDRQLAELGFLGIQLPPNTAAVARHRWSSTPWSVSNSSCRSAIR